MRKKNNGGRRETPSSNYTINDRIRAKEIRVIEGLPSGIYSIKEALEKADDLGLDLVMISENANPPVCKVIDFKKFLYEEKKEKKTKNQSR